MPTHGIDGQPLGANVMRRYLMGEWQYRNATLSETIDDAEPITESPRIQQCEDSEVHHSNRRHRNR